jgi:DNA repair protein RadD
MSVTLRPYQQRMHEETAAALRSGARGVLNVAPTGSGKGDCITHWLLECHRWSAPVTMAVHLREVALDVAARLRSHLPELPLRILAGVASEEGSADARCTIATWQTLEAREASTGARLFIADEAHRTKTATALSVLERHPDARLVGFTATGQRGDGSGLGPAGYERLIVGPQIEELVDAGHLSPVYVEAPDEYVEQLADDPARALAERHRPGDAWIVFASSIGHSHLIARELRQRGLRALHVDADTGSERDSSIARLESGALDVLTNFRLFTEGVNVRRCSGVMLASAFSHDGPYLQAIGRGRRTAPGKDRCRIVDLRGNLHRRGHPDEERTYHLEGTAIRRSSVPAPVVCCKRCLAWFKPRPCCPVCGAKAAPPKPPRISRKELKEQRQQRIPKEGPDWELWCALVQEQRRTGRKPQWAFFAFRDRTGGRTPLWPARYVPEEGTDAAA